MSLVVRPSSGEVPELEDGLYTATIMNVKQVKLDQPDAYGKTEKLEISLEIEVDGEPTAAQLADVEKAAEVLLSNPVIENFTVRVEK